jgi:hypothetical protein
MENHYPSANALAANMIFIRSSYKKVGGIVLFWRMLEKIRLHAAGRLPDGYNRGTLHTLMMASFMSERYRLWSATLTAWRTAVHYPECLGGRIKATFEGDSA